jgi:hypothetical protein
MRRHLPIMQISSEIANQAEPPLASNAINSELEQLLLKYHDIFLEPKELPPKRSYDHSIPLVPDSQPVNVRPYRYALQ